MALAERGGFSHKALMNIRRVLLLSVFALSACSSPPPPPAPQPAPAPRPVVVVPPKPAVPAGDWTDWSLAPGEWVYRRDERGSIALFGPAGQNATVTLRCDGQRRRIYLALAGEGAGRALVVRSSSALKEFAASPTGGTPAYLATEIMPTDPILDAMAYSRGRIAVEAGAQKVAIPSWAEITRVVEDCRG
jgi:hypothetical protein